MIPGLMSPDGKIDPIMLRAAMHGMLKIDDKIADLAKKPDVPGYVVDAVRGVRDAIDRWGLEVERAAETTLPGVTSQPIAAHVNHEIIGPGVRR